MTQFASIDNEYSVAGQLDAALIAEAAEAGFKTIINLRPDAEIPGYIDAAEAALCAEGYNLDYHHIEVAGTGPTPLQIAAFKAMLSDCAKPILGHCGSGRRAAVMWALAKKGNKSTTEILVSCAAAGHNISDMAAIL